MSVGVGPQLRNRVLTGDLRRMFTNAKVYNAPESVFYKVAEKLEASFNTMLAHSMVFPDDR